MLKKIFIISIIFTYTLFAQEFKLKSIEGDLYTFNMTDSNLTIKEFPNKVIMIDFFSSTCPPCIKELPELTKLQETFSETIQIMGIESGLKKDNAKMQKFADKYNLNYPVFGLEESGELIQFVLNQIQWNGALPYKLLYHSNGTLSYKLYGGMTWGKLMQALGNL